MIKLTNFTGEFPKLPPQLLPDNAAQSALNCDFTHGELRALNKPAIVTTTPVSQVAGIYTPDGVNFMTWNTPTKAYPGPVVDDAFGRIYFNNRSLLQVTQNSRFSFTRGNPTVSYKVGVPVPGPTATTQGSMALTKLTWTTWPDEDHSGAFLRFYFFWERAGVAMGEVQCSPSEIKRWREYNIASAPLGVGAAGNSNTNTTTTTVTRTFQITAYRQYTNSDTSNVDQSITGNTITAVVVDIGTATDCTVVGPQLISLPSSGSSSFDLTHPNLSGTHDAFAVRTPAGQWVDVTDLYVGGTEAITNLATTTTTTTTDPTKTDTTPTIDNSLACFKVELVDAITNDVLWTAYSNNSSMAADMSGVIPGGMKVVSGLADGKFTINLEWGVAETRAYTVTQVNDWNEESSPLEAKLVDLAYIEYVSAVVSNCTDPATWGYVRRKGFNLYCTRNNSSTYFLVNDTPLAGPTMVDRSKAGVSASPTATSLPSLEWDIPPSTATCLCPVVNGFFAVASGKDVWFSEPFHPHAWPYNMTFPYTVTGICQMESGILVTTTGYPYYVSGAHPSGMSQFKLGAVQAGISNQSMTPVEGGAVYASHDGLVFVKGAEASLAPSQQFFFREDWRSLYGDNLSQLQLISHDGYVVGMFPSTEGFVMRLDENGSFSRLSNVAYGLYIDPVTDSVYAGSAGFILRMFDPVGGKHDFDWISKDFVHPEPVNYGAAFLNADGETAVIVYADGEQVAGKAVPGGQTYFRLPATRKARIWAVEITGSSAVHEFYMANTMLELKNG